MIEMLQLSLCCLPDATDRTAAGLLGQLGGIPVAEGINECPVTSSGGREGPELLEQNRPGQQRTEHQKYHDRLHDQVGLNEHLAHTKALNSGPREGRDGSDVRGSDTIAGLLYRWAGGSGGCLGQCQTAGQAS